MAAPDLRVGIDVGGTNTDAVALDRSDALLAKAKVPTSADVTGGITGALAGGPGAPGGQRGRVPHANLRAAPPTKADPAGRRRRRPALLPLRPPAAHSS